MRSLLIACFLLFFSAAVTAQNSPLLRCQVKSMACKTRQANGNWTAWQVLGNINEQGPGNVVFDFGKMSLYSDSKPLDSGKSLDRSIHISRIVEIAHDTTFKEYGFYCIRFKCRDEKANLVSYELLSMGFNNCHSVVLIATTDKIVTKQELEIQ